MPDKWSWWQGQVVYVKRVHVNEHTDAVPQRLREFYTIKYLCLGWFQPGENALDLEIPYFTVAPSFLGLIFNTE